ncbi:MAG: hypothetical protein ACR2JU_12900 [Nocardioidaceae bacterium]
MRTALQIVAVLVAGLVLLVVLGAGIGPVELLILALLMAAAIVVVVRRSRRRVPSRS